MSEYCEYMWDPTRGHVSPELARRIYEDETRLEIKDKKLAIKTVRAVLRGMPEVDLKHCTDEYITRFLLARKYRVEQAAALIAAYQAQVAERQDIFGNLTARDPALQRALRAGIPGVLPARDKKGRCVLVILASQWDPIAVPALSVQRAIFLVLETLIQDPRNQQSGFVAVVDWSGFSLRQGGALGAAAVRNLIAALRGRFPARFKAIHFLSPPLYVQATLALVKPFLDEKTRHKIYLHGNNLSTLHEHLPTDILPAELGGTGPAFNPGLWAEPVIHSAMKEAELAAINRDKEIAKNSPSVGVKSERKDVFNRGKNGQNYGIPLIDVTRNTGKLSIENLNNVNNRRSSAYEDKNIANKSEKDAILKSQPNDDFRIKIQKDKEGNTVRVRGSSESEDIECLEFPADANSNEFEMISNQFDSDDSQKNSLDNLKVEKIVLKNGKEKLPEETNLIT
ncbi:clavesin-2-like [Chelonus insularis]|uniref:clavesin-2-like n=1 Tax=Chelonus insularis TaxID=460826 RepID=UPI00158CF4AE|nr:clavesin-2-like [Chelonus insularis]